MSVAKIDKQNYDSICCRQRFISNHKRLCTIKLKSFKISAQMFLNHDTPPPPTTTTTNTTTKKENMLKITISTRFLPGCLWYTWKTCLLVYDMTRAHSTCILNTMAAVDLMTQWVRSLHPWFYHPAPQRRYWSNVHGISRSQYQHIMKMMEKI